MACRNRAAEQPGGPQHDFRPVLAFQPASWLSRSACSGWPLIKRGIRGG
jgi:hypothetical protein